MRSRCPPSLPDIHLPCFCSSGSHMCYLAVFIVFVFLMLYKLFGK